MLFQKEKSQRPNLEATNGSAASPPGSQPQANSCGVADPAKLEAAHRKVKEILELGRIPDCLFRCGVGNGTLTLTGGPSQTRVLLLFSTVFAAADYLRAIGVEGTPMQLKAQNLPRFAQSCVANGVLQATLDRCPRCLSKPMPHLTAAKHDEVDGRGFHEALGCPPRNALSFGRDSSSVSDAVYGSRRSRGRSPRFGIR